MGFDPNHYGMFSIIPSSVISEIMFYPQGTEAIFNLPSAVEMMTSTPYNQPFDGEIDFSFLEATMALAWGSEKYFVLSSLRKSVLDKLADHLDDHSTKKQIPPTNFQDVFISSGINISEKSKIILDQYYVRDFLSYKSDPSLSNPEGVHTHQKTSISFIGIRYETTIDKLRLKAGAAWKTGHESYFARPYSDSLGNGFNVDLKAESRLATGFWQGEFVTTKSRLCIGGRLEYLSRFKIDLNQVNWNFLPPDYNSDNPYIYQNELNRLYGKYHTSMKEKDGSLYVDYQRLMGRFEIQSGIRAEYFGNLADKYELVYRNSLTLNMGANRIIKLFFGTYAENPANRITEPYQVLVHDNLNSLPPIKTRLLSLSYGHHPVTVSIFSKRISNRPVLTPDYGKAERENSAVDGFLRMSPGESVDFYGGDINLRLDGIPFEQINLNGYYGYTRANRRVYDLELPFSLVAPHRFYLQAEYMLNKMIKFGGDINIRSGYAYTPPYSDIDIDEQDRYSDDYYSKYLVIENSRKFPTYLNINLYFGLTFRNLEIYLNTLNVTNHDNPIISSSDGYIYDTGILPSLGIKYKF
jgi:hypothetical protein